MLKCAQMHTPALKCRSIISEKLSNRYSQKHCLHLLSRVAVTAGKVPVFNFRQFRESFRDQGIYKMCQIGPEFAWALQRREQRCNAQPLSQQGWTVDVSNGQSLVLGRDCVRWEVLNWLRDCNSEGLIEVNSMMPGALLSLGGCRGSSVTSLTGSRWASLH